MSKRISKKEHILLSGIEVMKKQGYNGCSIKDIVEEAKVPKGSFYNYFESKEAFAVEAIEWVAQEVSHSIQSALKSDDNSPLERLISYFESSIYCAIKEDFKVGCFLGNMGQEMSDSSDEVRNVVKKSMAQHTDVFKDTISEIIDSQSLDLDKEIASEFLFNAWKGAILRAKATKSTAPLDAYLTMLKRILS